MDVGTGIALFGPSALTLKVLGPTADYVGEGVKSWTALRVNNIKRILDAVEHNVDPDALDDPGAVPPRVLKGVLDEGSYVEDAVGTEYFAGVLASSRSEGGGDDRGVSLIHVLDSLSSVQLRAHYVIYRAAQAIAAAHPDVDWATGGERSRLQHLAVPTSEFMAALIAGRDMGEATLLGAATHIMNGLGRCDLLGGLGRFAMGSPEFLRGAERNVDWPDHAVVFHISPFGVELYCAAHGFSSDPLQDFKRPVDEFARRWSPDIAPCEVLMVSELPPYQQPDLPQPSTRGAD